MTNVRGLITWNNAHGTRNAQPNATDGCNCRNKDTCPLQKQCTTKNVVYKATVTTDDTAKEYIGMTSNTFKERYRNHAKSFQTKKYSNETELSNYVWQLQEKNKPFNISWSIVKKATPYTGGSKRCNLCLEEKFCILKANKQNLLNKRSELVSTCRHKRNFHFGKPSKGISASIVSRLPTQGATASIVFNSVALKL